MADMILGSAQGAVDSLLGRLTSVLVGEVQLLGGVRRDMQFIKDEMESMNGFLLHVAEADEEDHQVGAWMKQVAEVAYASQNSIDLYIQSLGGGRREPGFLGNLRRLPKLVLTLPTRHRIADQIRDLKIRACEVGERRMRYDVKVPDIRNCDRANVRKAGNDGTNGQEDARRRAWADHRFPQGRREMYGYCESVLTSLLKQAREEHGGDSLKVIAVVGMGGIGKSYGAERAYQDPSVVSSFDCKAWICLGQESTEASVFLSKVLAALDSPSDQFDSDSAQLQPNEEEELIAQVQPDEKEQLQPNEKEELITQLQPRDEGELIAQLQLRLKGKRFLLVIDDVRDRSLWNRIQSAFPHENCARGSCILITTRSIDVAQSVCPHENIDLDTGSHEYVSYAMGLMNITNQSDLCPILRDIVSKPLPVGLFLRALYVNPNKTKAELQTLCDNLDNSYTASSNNARQVLKFCNLTSNCKNCLLYMSIFPEHTILERTRLVRRWAAEGMTAKRGRLSALDEADHCFDLLVAHGFLKPFDRSDKRKVKSCEMPGHILEIVTNIAREDHFVKNNYYPGLAQHLSVHYEGEPHQAEKELNVTRSQAACWNIFRHQAAVEVSSFIQEFLDSLTSSSHTLKVLDLEFYDELKYHHLKNICDHVFHLKYLSLRGTGITELPKQLGKLQSLETLDIRETKVKAFPKNSVFLPKLKHLLAGHWTYEELDVNGNVQSKMTFSTVAIPKHIGDMTELQVISHIAVSGDGSELKCVGHLLQLVKLGVIVSGSKTSSVLRHLYHATGNLGYLRSLSIQVAETEEENENMNKEDAYPIYPKYLRKLKISGLKNGLPSWVEKLKALTKMTLRMTLITEDDFKILGWLTSLSWLTLQQESCNEGTLTFKNDAFQRLEFLDIECSAITCISFDNEACPKLNNLAWSSTGEPSLSGIERLPSLKKLELTGSFDKQSVMEAVNANKNSILFNHWAHV